MKTLQNTKNICKKAYAKMHILERLRNLNCPTEELLDVFKHQILSVVEQAVPYWGPMITKSESQMLERILKTCLHIIYQNDYKNFKNALKSSNMFSLSQRRKNIIFKFAQKCKDSPVFSHWFSKNDVLSDKQPTTRNKKPKYKPVTARTNRYKRSSLPVITKAISWHPPKIYVAPTVY